MSISPLNADDKPCANLNGIGEHCCDHPRSYHTDAGCLVTDCPCGQYIEPVSAPEFVQAAMAPSRDYYGSQANAAERKSFLEGTWYTVEEQHVCVFDSSVHLIPIRRRFTERHYANMLACACGKYKPYPINKD